MKEFKRMKKNQTYKEKYKRAYEAFIKFGAQPKEAEQAAHDQALAIEYSNNIYCVHCWRNEDADYMVHNPEWKGKIIYLSIKRHDKRSIHDWRDFQEIKNKLVGHDREAIELYPTEERVVDVANQYHLFVFPKGFIFPFGFTQGGKHDESTETTRQRPRSK